MNPIAALTQKEVMDLLPGLAKLDRDLVKALKSQALVLTRSDIRYLVDLYYQLQHLRCGADNQKRSQPQEPTELIEWVATQARVFEANIKRALDAWTKTHAPSIWARSVKGIGPVLAAGLAAHIDLKIATNVSKIWRFAGLDPTIVWKKKQKRPYNARLKVLCWKIGDSFVKLSNTKSYYGILYRERKKLEVERNETGEFAAQAENALKAQKNLSAAQKKTYADGKLPPSRLDLRARRYAVKLFLSHYFEVSYEDQHHMPPPRPWIVEQGHSKYVSHKHVLELEK